MSSDQSINWKTVKQNYSISPSLTYLDSAAYSPPSTVVLDEIEHWHRELATNPINPMGLLEMEAARQTLAEFIGAQSSEVAFTRSVVEGANLVLQGIPWKSGDEIVYDRGDHPRLVDALKLLERRYGVKAVDAGIDWLSAEPHHIPQRYAEKITDRTKLILASHVNYATGKLVPVREITRLTHKRGILSFIDSSLSFGALNFTVSDLDADFISAPGYKWIGAGYGSGFTYFKREAQDHVWPTTGGFIDPSTTSELEKSARRFDRNAGQKNIPSLLGFIAALTYQKSIGREAISDRLLHLSAVIRAEGKQFPSLTLLTPPSAATSLTCFSIAKTAVDSVKDALQLQGVGQLGWSYLNDHAVLRVSPHIFNTEDEIGRLLNTVARAAA